MPPAAKRSLNQGRPRSSPQDGRWQQQGLHTRRLSGSDPPSLPGRPVKTAERRPTRRSVVTAASTRPTYRRGPARFLASNSPRTRRSLRASAAVRGVEWSQAAPASGGSIRNAGLVRPGNMMARSRPRPEPIVILDYFTVVMRGSAFGGQRTDCDACAPGDRETSGRAAPMSVRLIEAEANAACGELGTKQHEHLIRSVRSDLASAVQLH